KEGIVVAKGVAKASSETSERVGIAGRVETASPGATEDVVAASRVGSASGVANEEVVAAGRVGVASLEAGEGVADPASGNVAGPCARAHKQVLIIGAVYIQHGALADLVSRTRVDIPGDIQDGDRGCGSNSNRTPRLKNRGITDGDVGWRRRRKEGHVVILGGRTVHDSVDSNTRPSRVGGVSRAGRLLLGCTAKN